MLRYIWVLESMGWNQIWLESKEVHRMSSEIFIFFHLSDRSPYHITNCFSALEKLLKTSLWCGMGTCHSKGRSPRSHGTCPKIPLNPRSWLYPSNPNGFIWICTTVPGHGLIAHSMATWLKLSRSECGQQLDERDSHICCIEFHGGKPFWNRQPWVVDGGAWAQAAPCAHQSSPTFLNFLFLLCYAALFQNNTTEQGGKTGSGKEERQWKIGRKKTGTVFFSSTGEEDEMVGWRGRYFCDYCLFSTSKLKWRR